MLPSKNKYPYCTLHLYEVIYTETSLIRLLSDITLKKSHFSQVIAYNEKDSQLLANLTLVQFYKYLCLHVMFKYLYEVDKQLHETFLWRKKCYTLLAVEKSLKMQYKQSWKANKNITHIYHLIKKNENVVVG